MVIDLQFSRSTINNMILTINACDAEPVQGLVVLAELSLNFHWQPRKVLAGDACEFTHCVPGFVWV